MFLFPMVSVDRNAFCSVSPFGHFISWHDGISLLKSVTLKIHTFEYGTIHQYFIVSKDKMLK
jgi:hypothetical protein